MVLFIFSISTQILVSVTILLGVIFLVFFAEGEDKERIVEMAMFLIIIIWSLYIPDWIRKRFDLHSERFNKIRYEEAAATQSNQSEP